MTMKTVLEEFEDNLIAKDDYIEMKCINCGYEEEMPDWVYGEEALFLREEGITDPPCWNCPKCHQDSLYRIKFQIEASDKHIFLCACHPFLRWHAFSLALIELSY